MRPLPMITATHADEDGEAEEAAPDLGMIVQHQPEPQLPDAGIGPPQWRGDHYEEPVRKL